VIRLLADACQSFNDNCAAGIEPVRANIAAHLDNSLMLVTALNNVIGYDSAARLAKHAHKTGLTLREAALELELLSGDDFDKAVRPGDMVGPLKL